MKGKTAVNFVTNVAIILALTALTVALCNTCQAQTPESDVYAYEYTAATTTASPYWSPSLWGPWWWDPDLDVHIGKPLPSLGGGCWIPVRVHNHWYGTAQNVNLEVYAQKRWIACLNRPPSLRLAEISFDFIPGGGSESVWVYWDQPKPGKSIYAQVDSGNLFTSGVYGPVPVSPYFRKNDHSSAGILNTPAGDPLASWHYQDPYQVAIDLVRNVNFPLGQNYEKNERNNWDYYKRYDARTLPGQPVIIPLPIPNLIPNLTFAGTLTLDADSVNNDMLRAVAVGTDRAGTAAATTAVRADILPVAAVTSSAFAAAPNNVLRFSVQHNEDNPEEEFPAAILVKAGQVTGTTEFKVVMNVDPQPGATDEEQPGEIEIHVVVEIAE